MLTISIMARFGPWILLGVEDLTPDKAAGNTVNAAVNT